jgi:hypothetical protein
MLIATGRLAEIADVTRSNKSASRDNSASAWGRQIVTQTQGCSARRSYPDLR